MNNLVQSRPTSLEIIKSVLLLFLFLLSLFSVVSLIFCIFEVIKLDFSFNKTGLLYFISFFQDFKSLYASTIAVISIYYWIIQMDNIEKSNTKWEKEQIDKKKENAIVESRYFHAKFQPIVRALFDLVIEKDESLFEYKWNFDHFTDESVNRQNPTWETKFEAIENLVKKELNAVNFELDSIAANILHGDIDNELAFKLIGKPFCYQVRILYPFIAGYRSEKRKIDYLSNTVALFNTWNPKIVD